MDTTRLHVAADGAYAEVYARGADRVVVILGRDAGSKVARLRAAGFALASRLRANDVADLALPGQWIDDGLPLLECAASGADPLALLALARGV